jgi:xanthine dehydrogenase YagS FAD-binding subunit
MNRFAWTSASTTSAAASAASTTVADAMTAPPDATHCTEVAVVKAGGIDLLDLLKENLLAPGLVVSLREISGLDTVVQAEGGGWRIGAMVTLATLAEHPILRQRYPALVDAVRCSASPDRKSVV